MRQQIFDRIFKKFLLFQSLSRSVSPLFQFSVFDSRRTNTKCKQKPLGLEGELAKRAQRQIFNKIIQNISKILKNKIKIEIIYTGVLTNIVVTKGC